ncbi:MAG: hypothetical protein ABEH65_00905 [Halobacteriales archaeon]
MADGWPAGRFRDRRRFPDGDPFTARSGEKEAEPRTVALGIGALTLANAGLARHIRR